MNEHRREKNNITDGDTDSCCCSCCCCCRCCCCFDVMDVASNCSFPSKRTQLLRLNEHLDLSLLLVFSKSSWDFFFRGRYALTTAKEDLYEVKGRQHLFVLSHPTHIVVSTVYLPIVCLLFRSI